MKNYKRLGIAFSLIILSGCVNFKNYNPPLQAKATAKELRITSYNINWGEGVRPITHPEKNIQAISTTHADIVLLQESTPYWERQIKHSKLQKIYPYKEFRHYSNGGGAAIISRYPFHTLLYHPPTIGWHPLWIVNIATKPLGNIDLVNAHLTPQVIKEGEVGFLGRAIFSSRPLRKREARNIVQNIKFKHPIIIAGDFNEGDNGSAGKFLQQQGFVDGLKQNGFRQITWEWQSGPFNFNDRFDRFFYTPSLKLVKVQVVHAGNSDHYPIVGDFKPND